MRTPATALEHVLSIEMGALAIVGRDGVKHRKLVRAVRLMQKLELRVQRKGSVESQRALWSAGGWQRELATQPRVVGITIGRHGRQAVECPAQNHEDQSRITARVCERDALMQQDGAGRERASGKKCASLHRAYLVLAAQEFGRRESRVSACGAVAACASAVRVASLSVAPSSCGASCCASRCAPRR